MIRTMKQLADAINTSCPRFEARLERSYHNTDRKPPGLRYITRKGKGRRGWEITVYRRGTEDIVFSYDTGSGSYGYMGYALDDARRLCGLEVP